MQARANGNETKGPFTFRSAANVNPDTPIVGAGLDEWRLNALSGADGETIREVSTVQSGGLRFTHWWTKYSRIGEWRASKDYVSIHRVLKGHMTVSVGNTTIATAGPGQYSLALNRSPVLTLTSSADYASLILYIQIPDARRLALRGGGATLKRFAADGRLVLPPSALWDTHLANALDCTIQAASAQREGITDRILCEYLYLLFCAEIAAQARLQDDQSERAILPMRLKLAEDFIQKNIKTAPSVDQVAAAISTSTRVLHTLFVKYHGASPGEYMREQRLVGIRNAMLKSTRQESVAAYAVDWGYQNFGHFAAAYKDRFGELPSATLSKLTHEKRSKRPK